MSSFTRRFIFELLLLLLVPQEKTRVGMATHVTTSLLFISNVTASGGIR
jgi:hypothetical protein